MATEFILQQTNASGRLLPSRFAEVFAQIATKLRGAPRGTMQGQELRFGIELSPTDDACAGFLLDFVGQGLRATGTAHGPSAALLSWAFHTVADATGGTLAVDGDDVPPDPKAHLVRAIAWLTTYEASVRTSRKDEDDGAQALVSWLAHEQYVALAEGATLDELPMTDTPALYEALLESDAVEDVFVSEREMSSILARFRARFTEQT